MRLFFLTAGVLSVLIAGCSKENPVRTVDVDSYVYEPIRVTGAYVAMAEKPDATRALLVGDEAKKLSPTFKNAGVRPLTSLDGKFDVIVVSCGEMSAGSCARMAAHLSENGVMMWMMDMRGVTSARFRSMVRSFDLESVHLWMPGESQWLLVGRRVPRKVRLSAMLDVFAREGTFYDLEKARCGTLPELFASYAGTREDILPAFVALTQSDEVRPANFLSRKVAPVDWISTEGMDEDIARDVLSEMRSVQVVRRQVVEGALVAATARDKKDEERATDIWARSFLRNPRDLFLLERMDRLERNAQGFLAVGKVLQAMKCYETLVLISPNDASAVRNFGLCLKRIGKADLADKVLARAKALVDQAQAH